MSILEELISIRVDTREKAYLDQLNKFKNHERKPVNLSKLDEIYSTLRSIIKEFPDYDIIPISLSENLEESYALMDLLHKNGLKNLSLNPSFRRIEEFSLQGYWIDLTWPFNKDAFNEKECLAEIRYDFNPTFNSQ